MWYVTMQVIYVYASVPWLLIPIVLEGQVFLIYNFHSSDFHKVSQLAVKSRSIWGHKMAGSGNMSDTSVVEPDKSPLTEWLDPVLVPDLDTAQATGQGSTLHGYEPNTHTLYLELHMNQLLTSSRHMSKGAGAPRICWFFSERIMERKSEPVADAERCTCVLGFYNAALILELFVLFRTVWSELEYSCFLLGKLLSWWPRQCWEGIYRADRSAGCTKYCGVIQTE